MQDSDSSLLSIKPKKNRLNILPPNPEDQKHELVGSGRFPSWLHRPLPKGTHLQQTAKILAENRLHTVCEEAKCPNLLECWSRKTATFLILGKECTRSCGFCDIDFSKAPKAPDGEEPARVADSVAKLNLKHVVITMVARDDLTDGGSHHLVAVMNKIREDTPNVTIEVLTSDFAGNKDAWQAVIDAKPHIFNHNIESVRELSPRVRHKATYERTLELLNYVSVNKTPQMKVKSGLMVGFGETEEQVFQTLRDLKQAGCDIVTIGQYLQASRLKLSIKSFVTPDQFKKYEEFGYQLGFSYVYAAPFVRSSYNAGLVLEKTEALDQTL